MAQLDCDQVLAKALTGEMEFPRAVRSLIDRESGRMKCPEGSHLDFKEKVDLGSPSSVGELARDILAFSNTEAGVLLVGVRDDGKVLGHNPIDSGQIRQVVGRYAGTRVVFSVGTCDVAAQGSSFIVSFIVVQRTTAAGPSLLKRDIDLTPPRAQKVKYRAGSLFYREGDRTLAEPPGDGVFERARILNFTYATPRARSSLWLADDRPGLRVYEHINDRFFGREAEVGELLTKLGSPKGRGVSIAGLGGIGKTELAIEVVLKAHNQHRFKRIYSGSAKTLMMTPGGVQHSDPMFQDFPSFVQDLAAWLGIDSPLYPTDAQIEGLAAVCLRELKVPERTLLFVDNLETVADPKLFKFLDNELPESVSLITTSRVHKLRNFMYQKELTPLPPRDSAKLLRHELHRQGLDRLASTLISQLEEKAEQLYGNPLAIRWFAWACTKDPRLWDTEISTLIQKHDIDEFCVAHTLRNLPATSSKVLSAIAALQDQASVESDLLLRATKLSPEVLDRALWDLECAGLVRSLTSDFDGKSSFTAVPLAAPAAREFGRKHHWEPEFVRACNEHFKDNPRCPTDDPLLNDLLNRDPRDIREMTPEQRQELLRRVCRAKAKGGLHENEVILLQLEAECHRRDENIITARDLYSQAADKILGLKLPLETLRYQEILLEAGTVVKQSGTSIVNLSRAAKYLEAAKSYTQQRLRLVATLAEVYSLLGQEAKFKENYDEARHTLDEESTQFSFWMREKAEAALLRSEQALGKSSRNPIRRA